MARRDSRVETRAAAGCHRSGGASGVWRSVLTALEPSVISIAWSGARSRNVWVDLLAGHEIVRASTRIESPSPIISTRLLPPKLELLPTVRWMAQRMAVGRFEIDADPGTKGRAIRRGADELDLQPMTSPQRVLKQRVERLVAGRCAAELHEQVQVAVAIPVGEGNTMPLLKVAGAGRNSDVVETRARNVSEHEVDVQSLVRHVAGAEVDVEEPVVVDVAEIRAHGRHRPIKADLPRDVAEASRTEVAVEPGPARPFDLEAHRARENLGDPSAVVVDVEIDEPVVVVVPKPASKAEIGTGDAKLRCDVAKLAAAFIMVEAARLAHIGHKEVEPAIAIIVAPRRALGAALVGEAGCVRDVLEGAVA